MTTPLAHSGTLLFSVEQTGFLLDRMAKDCSDLQFLRELTQNSIEAILRTPKKSGEIVWDVDWTTYDLTGIYKLCVTDNGDGMTGEDMLRYINHLSSSGGVQAHNANYGVGAKIAAATRNPAGLVYLSWRDNVGSMIHFWKDPQSGEYGLMQIRRPDDSWGHWAHVENSVKPDMIDTHGTKVVLYGLAEDTNTMAPPEGAPSPSRWVTKYLNTRYFRFPEGVVVKAREGWENDRSDKDRNVLRTIIGQKQYLDDHASASGIVEITNARVHWWILRSESALSQNTGFIGSSGHCAALWKDELYETTVGRGNTAALQNFGVIFGYTQVVIYVEPIEVAGVEILTNTARTALIINGKTLPWADWQDEFRQAMPKEITEHMEAIAAGSKASDHKDSIKDRLKQIEELFKLSRYRPIKGGPLLVRGDTQASGGGTRSGEGKGRGAGGAGSQPGATPSIYSLFLTENGVPGTTTKPDLFPIVRWVSVADGTRPVGEMEDRAAKYLEKDNMLQINADFRVFADMIKRWTDYFGSVPGAHPVVQEVVREWFEQSLVEAVLSSNTLRNARHWSIEDVQSMLSQEGLTAVVLPRWHIEQSIKRALGSKFGALKGKVA
ncbi:MAG: hypothetical protein A2V78_15875 [Betaproteobacteria bacterium RBG_16_64_18]|nr:MAG: hypothetical protein A2V78_15875 [Betaproteobacteria bacterium RBG_16_64_18]